MNDERRPPSVPLPPAPAPAAPTTTRIDIYVHVDAASAPADPRVDQIVALITTLTQKVTTMSGNLDSSIATLIADNQQLKSDIDAAPASIATLVAAAIAGAINTGATPAQLQAMADLHTALSTDHTELTSALAGTAPVVTPAPGA
jgi:hypothetical protein